MADDAPPPKPLTDEQRKRSAELVAEARKYRQEQEREERQRIARHKHRLALRLQDGLSWPINALTGERAEDIDPEDVNAPLPVEIAELTPEQIHAAAAAEADFGADETLTAHRRAELERELADLERVRGATWTEELVEARIEEAFRVLFRSGGGGRIGPRAYGNAMPTPVREMSDLVAQAGNKSLRKAMGRLLRNHGPPTPDETRRMEEALEWSMRYLRDDRDLAMCLNFGGLWKAWGASISKKCAEIGLRRQSFYRDRKEAVRRIVEGLVRDGRAPT